MGRSVKLTHRDKLMIVNYHNDIRRLIFASNMQTLSWDSYAAAMAREWGRNCIFNRPWDDHYGENLYKTYFTKASRSREVMMDALKDWEKEKQNLFSWNAKCTESETCNYAQLVSAKTDRVGCALIKCPKMIEGTSTTNYNMHYFLCFYSPRVEFNKQPFTYGKQCSACPDAYRCKRKMCRRPKWEKINREDDKNNKIPVKTFKPPTADIVIREKSGQIRPYRNSSYSDTNILLPIPPAALTGRQPSEKVFNGETTSEKGLSRRVKRQSRQYFSYDEWRRRERLKQERLRAEQQYRLEERRRQRLQQEAYRRRQQRRPSAQIRRRPSAHIRRRRPQRQIEPGSITTEEKSYITQAHNMLRGNEIQKLTWSRYLERWAKYVIRCDIEYPGPITTYTNFGKASNGGNIYNIVYDWGNEGYNVNQILRYGCRTPSDRERCNHNVIIRNEFLRDYACASKNCSNGMRQLTCIYR